jgi:hypothetical protein
MSNPTEFTNDQRFDGLYLNVAQTTRGIDPLLDTLFGFLRRKTDFFNGPPGAENDSNCDAAIAKVHEILNRHVLIYKQDCEKKRMEKKATKATAGNKKRSNETHEKEPPVIEMGNDGFDISNVVDDSNTMDSNVHPHAATATTVGANENQNHGAGENDNGDNVISPTSDATEILQEPSVGNGGVVAGKYSWTQTLAEVSISIPLPDNTRGRDLNVVMKKNHLKVGLKSTTPTDVIIDAPLTNTILVDDSFWTVEDGNRLSINLQKVNQMEWWDSVCVGHDKIDIKKVQPENSNLNDLDADTRQTVEKMMFDQRQKALGLPSADEQRKLDALEKFKKAHPEMDFSNAKIS